VASRTRVGLEFKVCQFPRMKNTSPATVSYDVGQIGRDLASLRQYKLNFAYCVIVLHGPFVEANGINAQTIERWFHNAMYADFQASMLWGYFNKKDASDWVVERNASLRAIRRMGLNKPFERTSKPENFCRLYPAQRLAAVVGLCSRGNLIAPSQ
jgi:hypothetical protein